MHHRILQAQSGISQACKRKAAATSVPLTPCGSGTPDEAPSLFMNISVTGRADKYRKGQARTQESPQEQAALLRNMIR